MQNRLSNSARPRSRLKGFSRLGVAPGTEGEGLMLRVRKEDLRLGMFIQSLEGSWFDHPFWRSKFLLTSEDDLRALQSSDVETVWVDKDKSLPPAIAHLVGEAPARPTLVEEAPSEPAATA